MQPEFHYGFTEAKSDKGVTYYVNDATGETSWEKPATGDIHGALAPAKAVVKAVAISAPGGPSGAPPIRSPPPGSIGGIQLVSIQAGSQQIAAGLQSLDKDAPVIEPFEISTIWFCRPCYHEKREATFFPGMIKFKHTKKLLCYPEEDSEVFVLRHDVIHTTFRKSLKSKWAIFAPILNALTLIVPLIILACLVAMIQTCSMVPTVAGCEACVNIEDATSASAGFKTCNRKDYPTCMVDNPPIPDTFPGCGKNNPFSLPKDDKYCDRFAPKGSGPQGECKEKTDDWEKKCGVYFQDDPVNGQMAMAGKITCPIAIVGFFASIILFILLVCTLTAMYFFCNAATFTVYARHDHSTWADGCISGIRKCCDGWRALFMCRDEDEGPIGSYGEAIASFPLEWTFQCRTNDEEAGKCKYTVQMGKYSTDLDRKTDLIRRYLYAPFVRGSGQLHKYNHFVGKGVNMVHVSGGTELDRQHTLYTPQISGALAK